jgi:hypothetical protein
MHAVGDEHLAAIDDIDVAVALRRRLDVRDVGATSGFRHPEGDDLLALDRRRQPALLLLISPEVIDRRRGDRNVRADAGEYPA